MKKFEIIKKNTEFNDIINKGKCLKGKYYNIYYKDSNNDFPMFGLAVSKKCGIAVVRNKIKRRLRMIIANNKFLFKNNKKYIIMVKRDIAQIDYKKMEENLIAMLEERTKNEKN